MLIPVFEGPLRLPELSNLIIEFRNFYLTDFLCHWPLLLQRVCVCRPLSNYCSYDKPACKKWQTISVIYNNAPVCPHYEKWRLSLNFLSVWEQTDSYSEFILKSCLLALFYWKRSYIRRKLRSFVGMVSHMLHLNCNAVMVPFPLSDR